MITWPFRFVGGIVGVALRFTAAAVALALMAVGILISLTVIGAVVGVPIFAVGLLILWKSILG